MKDFVVQVLAYEPLFVNKRMISETRPFQDFLFVHSLHACIYFEGNGIAISSVLYH